MLRRNSSGPWYGRDLDRLKFERFVRCDLAGLRSGPKQDGQGWCYKLRVEPPGCPSRFVRIEFRLGSPRQPRVFVDGPEDSPHRYEDGSLCMWFPEDGLDRRWVFEDGLHALVGQVQTHLIKEYLWRKLGEWPGEEAPHQISDKRIVA